MNPVVDPVDQALKTLLVLLLLRLSTMKYCPLFSFLKLTQTIITTKQTVFAWHSFLSNTFTPLASSLPLFPHTHTYTQMFYVTWCRILIKSALKKLKRRLGISINIFSLNWNICFLDSHSHPSSWHPNDVKDDWLARGCSPSLAPATRKEGRSHDMISLSPSPLVTMAICRLQPWAGAGLETILLRTKLVASLVIPVPHFVVSLSK